MGLLSDFLRGDDKSPQGNFFSLIHAFYVVSTLLIISGLAFLMAAKNLPVDIHSFKVEIGEL